MTARSLGPTVTPTGNMRDAAISEQHYRLMVDNVRDFGIIMMDTEGRILSWNPGAQGLFGYTADEVLQQHVALLFTPEDRAAGVPQGELITAASEGRAADDRWQLRKDGSRFWASGASNAMRDDSGQLYGFTKVLRDVTDQKRLAEEREGLLESERMARSDAERATVVRDEFLAVVTHELRTPLAAVALWAKLLRGGLVDQGEQPRALAAIEEGVMAQQRLIEDLLDASRMLSGNLRLDLRPTDLAVVIDRAVATLRPVAEAKGVKVTVTSAVTEAGGGSGSRALLDADRMQQVVWNLLDNAVKFTGGGGQVSIHLRRVGEGLELGVTDTGRGIRPSFLPHVFDRFRMADAGSRRTQGGLGLGMALTRQLVELHGGRIEVQSAGQDRGATFRVWLPIDRAEASAQPAAGPGVMNTPAPEGHAHGVEGVRVLLVEDDTRTREALAFMLRRWRADVVAAGSVGEALEVFDQSVVAGAPFDVVVSDLGMPGRDGYDLLDAVRALEVQEGRRRTPMLALTAYVRDQDRQRALAAGFDAYLGKPVDPVSLLRTITALRSAAREALGSPGSGSGSSGSGSGSESGSASPSSSPPGLTGSDSGLGSMAVAARGAPAARFAPAARGARG